MSKPKPNTFLEEADELSPLLCISIARKGKRGRMPIEHEEIAIALGWSVRKVAKVGNRPTWKGLAIEEVDAFRAACGITRQNERRHRAYLKATRDLSKTANGMSAWRRRPANWRSKNLKLLRDNLPEWLTPKGNQE